MLEIVALLCLAGALGALYALCVIDLRENLLPNELVLAFAGLSLGFHFATLFHYITLADMALGALIGGGFLYLIRAAANKYYQADTLGLGDVKLLAAAGLWLGSEYILMALIAGALAGLAHGLLRAAKIKQKTKEPVDLKKLSLPAGPGFAVGIVAAGIFKFYDFPMEIIL